MYSKEIPTELPHVTNTRKTVTYVYYQLLFTWNLTRDLRPLIVETSVQGQQQPLLFLGPRSVTETRVQVVQVTLAALLADPPGHVVGDLLGRGSGRTTAGARRGNPSSLFVLFRQWEHILSCFEAGNKNWSCHCCSLGDQGLAPRRLL